MSKNTLARHRRFARTTPEGGGGGNSPTPPAPTPAGDRPEGVSETEWAALGDPGRTALNRERERAKTAEQALAAARATPPPPPKPTPPTSPKPGDQPDIAAMIRDAVQAAVNPLIERDATREASQAAERIRDAVTTAAGQRFHDASDALAQVDLTTLTDGEGRVDAAKVTAALDELLTRKPHLGKAVDHRRRAADGSLIGGGGSASTPLEDRVKAQLALMNQY